MGAQKPGRGQELGVRELQAVHVSLLAAYNRSGSLLLSSYPCPSDVPGHSACQGISAARAGGGSELWLRSTSSLAGAPALGAGPAAPAPCPYAGVTLLYVREVKGPDSLVLLWHVCLAKDKFLSENLPEQLAPLCRLLPVCCGFPSSRQLFTLAFRMEPLGKMRQFLNRK